MIGISSPSYRDNAEDQPNLRVYATRRQEEEDGKSLAVCVTNVTRLLLECFVVIFTNININVFWSLTKRFV